MNIRTRILTVAAAGGVLLAGVAGATGYATAQEPGTAPGATAHEKRVERRDHFLGRVAANLGVTLEQLKQSFKSAATGAVDDALRDGKITQEQAGKAKAAIDSGKAPGLRKLLGGGRRDKPDRIERLRDGILKSAATALHMSPDDLKTQLKSGKSIADVAGANLGAVKAQILADAKAKLDAAVAANKLTQEKANQALQKLTDSLDKILNKTRGEGGQNTTPPTP